MSSKSALAKIATLLIASLLLISPVLTSFGAAVDSGSAATESVSGQAGLVQNAPNQCVGTVTDRPNGTTLLSIQGARGSQKTAAMLVAIRPNGSVIGVHNGSANDRWWFYDVDRLANGNLLLSTTEPGVSVIEEINATTGEHVWIRRFPDVLDSHDVDLINGDELLLNDMSQNGEDRVISYNLSRDKIVWEYRFANHSSVFPREGGGEYGGDWTHNNDVEQIRPGVFMVSVRNFDQVVAIDRETKEIRWKLGTDDDKTTLYEQHNPDYIEGKNGTPTVLVADSLNDRVVEYARENGEWVRTWVLRGGGLNEPRDADRLPNGNTLVVDRRGDRLLEVTPDGEVVWEFYAPWQPYDAERVGTGDESSRPTARQLGTTGVYEMRGSAGVDESQTEACYAFLTNRSGGGRLVPPGEAANVSLRNETRWKTRDSGDSALEQLVDRFVTAPVLAGSIIVVLAVTLVIIFLSLRSDNT